MKCHSLFSGKNKKNISKCCLLQFYAVCLELSDSTCYNDIFVGLGAILEQKSNCRSANLAVMGLNHKWDFFF